MSDNSEKILAKVRALLAKADSTNHPEEADAFRAKADEMMTLYAIEQWQLEQDTPSSTEIKKVHMDVSWYNELHHGLENQVWQMFMKVGRHCRCKVINWSAGYSTVPVLGMEADLSYFDMLFTSLYMQMSTQLFPKVDPDREMIDNLVVLKEAGWKWESIGNALIDAGQLDGPYDRKMGVRFTSLYSNYCKENNRDQVRVSPTVYQRSFAQGFVQEVGRRLRNQERQQKASQDDGGSGMELVVRDIKQRLEEAAFDQYGKNTSRAVSRDYTTSREAYGRGSEAGSRADINVNPGQHIGGRKALES